MQRNDLENTSPCFILAFFIIINAVLRIVFFNINSAEYTDGILQLTLFQNPTTLWPPLYTVLALALKPIAGSLIAGGKMVSLFASIAVMIPLFYLTVRLFNRMAGIGALLLYTVSPVVLRWSIRVMTDSLFAFFFLTAIYLLMLVVESPRDAFKRRAWLIAAFIFLSGLSVLTRYQGFLLLPIVLILLAVAIKNHKSLPVVAVSFIPWIFVAVWMYMLGFGHSQQVAERTAPSIGLSLLAYWINFESFIAFFPYFLTYPIAFLFLFGTFHTPLKNAVHKVFLGVFLYSLISVLVAQSVFSSFQSRYLLPIILLIIVYAGYGLSLIEEGFRDKRQWIFSAIVIVACAYGIVFSLAVIVFQRQAFGDIRASAEYVAREIPSDSVVYSTEMYKPEIVCPKMRYWSGRDIQFFHGQPLSKGEVLCVHTAYGGDAAADYLLSILTQQYQLREIAHFEANIVPLLPDIMENPISHQNPLAWFFRYTPQTTITTIYIISGIRDTANNL